MAEIDRVIAGNIAAIADKQGVPIKRLASLSGISDERLRGYIAHGRGSLHGYEVESLAKVLGVEPSTLGGYAA